MLKMTTLAGFKVITNHPAYLISNDGKVYSKLSRKLMKLDYDRFRKTRVKPCVVMREAEKQQYTPSLIEKLVAEAFVPNPNNKKFINHKDGDIYNNNSDNLEWIENGEQDFLKDFKPIDEFPDYLISRDVKIYSLATGTFLAMGDRYKKQKEKPAVHLSDEKKSVFRYLEKLVADAFVPNPDNKKFVNHKDGDIYNNNVDNLEWMDNGEQDFLKDFKPIEDFPSYLISPDARIYSLLSNKFLTANIEKFKKTKERVMIKMRKEGKLYYQLRYRLVANAFIPNVENKAEVNHKDGDPYNDCAENLEWTTRQENVTHSVENNLRKKKCNNAKVIEEFENNVKVREHSSVQELIKELDVSYYLINKSLRHGGTFTYQKLSDDDHDRVFRYKTYDAIENEEWRTVVIDDEKTTYDISNMGRLRNNNTGYVTKGAEGTGNYLHSSVNYVSYKMHRLVCMAFVPNPENKKFVDHINTIKSDNRASNLRWVTQSENMLNTTTLKKTSVPITQLDLEKNVVAVYKSMATVKKTCNISHLTKFIDGRLESVDGYYWRKATDEDLKLLGDNDYIIKEPHTVDSLKRTKTVIRQKKCIVQLSKDGTDMVIYDSVSTASKIFNKKLSVSRVIEGIQKTAGGYKWRLGTTEDRVKLGRSEYLTL